MSKKDKDNLEYYWIAEFNDGTIIKQFLPDYTEISYGEVLKRIYRYKDLYSY